MGRAQGTNVVVLDPDVATVFPSAEAVNRSLRALAGIIRRQKKPLAAKQAGEERLSMLPQSTPFTGARPGRSYCDITAGTRWCAGLRWQSIPLNTDCRSTAGTIGVDTLHPAPTH